MVLSVDDLVASLSNNHIGQEAIDIAALHASMASVLDGSILPPPCEQAQLSQAIFAQESGASKSAEQIKPCNTPTTTTTMSCPWNRVAPTDDMEYQDEQMVEELLIPCVQTSIQTQANVNPHSPLSYQPSGAHEAYYFAHQSSENYPILSHNYGQAAPTSSDHCPAFDPSLCSSPSSPSLFTSTDPFYIAQLQEMQMQIQGRAAWSGYDSQTHNSNFARLGKPDETSPFLHVGQIQAQVQAPLLPLPLPPPPPQRRELAQVQAQPSDFLQQMYHHHQFYPATAVRS